MLISYGVYTPIPTWWMLVRFVLSFFLFSLVFFLFETGERFRFKRPNAFLNFFHTLNQTSKVPWFSTGQKARSKMLFSVSVPRKKFWYNLLTLKRWIPFPKSSATKMWVRTISEPFGQPQTPPNSAMHLWAKQCWVSLRSFGRKIISETYLIVIVLFLHGTKGKKHRGWRRSLLVLEESFWRISRASGNNI